MICAIGIETESADGKMQWSWCQDTNPMGTGDAGSIATSNFLGGPVLSIRHVHGGKGDYDIHIEKGSGSGYITMGQ